MYGRYVSIRDSSMFVCLSIEETSATIDTVAEATDVVVDQMFAINRQRSLQCSVSKHDHQSTEDNHQMSQTKSE